MHAPLTSLVGECGHTKITKAKKTKKRPWHWDEVHQKAFDDVKAVIAKDVALITPKNLKSTLMPHPNKLLLSLLRVTGPMHFSSGID